MSWVASPIDLVPLPHAAAAHRGLAQCALLSCWLLALSPGLAIPHCLPFPALPLPPCAAAVHRAVPDCAPGTGRPAGRQPLPRVCLAGTLLHRCGSRAGQLLERLCMKSIAMVGCAASAWRTPSTGVAVCPVWLPPGTDPDQALVLNDGSLLMDGPKRTPLARHSI